MRAAMTPQDMPYLYQLWDVLLYLSGSEGFGLPAWEALASGLPVVYTEVGAPDEYLGQAQAGLPESAFDSPSSIEVKRKMEPTQPYANMSKRISASGGSDCLAL